MEGFLQLSTAVNITVLMVDSTDHITGKTGLTLTIYATKAAGAPAAITPTVTELDSTNVKGVYKLALTTTHTNTLGELQLHITSTGADPTDIKWQVSTYLPGEQALVQSGTGTGQISLSSGLVTLAGVTHTGAVIPTVTAVTNQLTAAAIATGIWQDSTGTDFTTASSIGKCLYVGNIVPGASGGLFISGSNAATTVNFTGNLSGSVGSVTADVGITQAGADKAWSTATRVLTAGTNIALAKGTGVTGFNDITVTSIWQDTTGTDFTTASSIGKCLYTGNVVPGGTNGLFIAGTNAATTITTGLTTTFTGNLTGSVGSVTGAVGSVTGAVGSVTAAVTLPSIPANWITAAGINTAAMNGKGDWNIGKTGYSLTQTFPANFSSLSINGSGLVTFDQTATVSTFTGKPATIGQCLYFVRQFAQNKLNFNKSTNQMILYEDDGTTAKITYSSMVDDASSATRTMGT